MSKTLVTIPIDKLPAQEGRGGPDGMKALFLSITSPVGLLHPPVLNSEYQVVAGRRRIAAARMAGWTEIPCYVCDDFDDPEVALQAEGDENTCRMPWKASEIAEHAGRVEAAAKKRAKARQREAGRNSPGIGPGLARDPAAPPRRVRARGALEETAAQFGIGERTLTRIKAVKAAADAEPKKYGDLVQMMDDESPAAAHDEMRRRRGEDLAPKKKGDPLRDAAGKDVPAHLPDGDDPWLGEAVQRAKDLGLAVAKLKAEMEKRLTAKTARIIGLLQSVIADLNAVEAQLNHVREGGAA